MSSKKENKKIWQGFRRELESIKDALLRLDAHVSEMRPALFFQFYDLKSRVANIERDFFVEKTSKKI